MAGGSSNSVEPTRTPEFDWRLLVRSTSSGSTPVTSARGRRRLQSGGATSDPAVATNTNHTTEIDYGAIDADLLCLWGATEEEQPVEDGRRLVDDVGGEVVSFDDAGHWVTEDRPAAYRDRLRAFLAE